MGWQNLQQFIEALRMRNQVRIIDTPVDAHLEVAEIHRRVIAAGGPALLFTRVKGKSFPLITNLFGTRERVELAFGSDNPIEPVVKLAEKLFPPQWNTLWKYRSTITRGLRSGTRTPWGQAPVMRCQIPGADLTQLPALTSWHEDGGPFLTLPLVHTTSFDGKPSNLGMYRVQIFEPGEAGMHFQIGKGGGFHLHQAEQRNEALPVNIYLGGPPSLLLSAICPLPENVPELLMASFLSNAKLGVKKAGTHPIPVMTEAEFCISGYVPPHVRRPEGPFGDHYGYYSLQHDFPVFRPSAIYHRPNAIFPATVVGKPCQEDFHIGEYLQSLLSPLFPLAMPAIRDLWSYGECGFHALSAAVLQERYYREALSAAFRILGEGQLALTKFLFCLDSPVPLRDFPAVLTHLLERVEWRTDLYVIGDTAMDTLDYSGPSLNKGSKAVILGLGAPKRSLPRVFFGEIPPEVRKVHVFSPGCLVIEGVSYEENPRWLEELATLDFIRPWSLVVVVESVAAATCSSTAFLWTTFTRLDPMQDLYAAKMERVGHRVAYEPPILFDARVKPSYPRELFCEAATAKQVTQNWNRYFPAGGVEMGDIQNGPV
jgi:UbiD family decarboxylase